MRFTVIGYGSEGDSRPIVALCKGLLQRGHEVQYLTTKSTASFAEKNGVPTKIISGDLKEMMIDDLTPNQSNLTMRQIIADNKASWMRDIAWSAVQSDAILCSRILLSFAKHVGHQMNMPVIHLGLTPTTPTREFSIPKLAPLRLPAWLKLLSYRLQDLADFFFGADAVHEKIFTTIRRKTPHVETPSVYGISKHLVPQPKNWSTSQRICGAWHYSSPKFEPSIELLDFLKAGPPPIYIGFGSVSGRYTENVFESIIAAVGDRRAIFFPGWTRIDFSKLPSNFFVVGETSHDWLFPQMSMIIHHGGAGTTHAATRAGVPSIVIPKFWDQPFWALRLRDIGIAPQYLKGANITSYALKEMIDFVSREEVRKRAYEIGQKMSQEDGVSSSVLFIEDMVKQRIRDAAFETNIDSRMQMLRPWEG